MAFSMSSSPAFAALLCLLVAASMLSLTAGDLTQLPPSSPGVDPGVELIVDSSTGRIKDSSGRERFFHGTNVVYKRPPYHPSIVGPFDSQFSLVDEDLQLLQEMGYNCIRLGCDWAGAEPSENGGWNETWFGVVESIVASAGQRGIFSLLDMHQDALANKFCGSGFPDWVMHPDSNDFPVPLNPKPVPIDPKLGYPNETTCDSINDNNFPAYYLAYAASTAIGNLYENQNGEADRFLAFWHEVASRFAKSPYVLGYEIMNEPFAGNWYKDPLLLIPGVADRLRLQPLYDKVASAIYSVDEKHFIFFESVTWEIAGIGEAFGFEHVPGGPGYANRSVLSFHNSVLPNVTPESKYYPMRMGEIKRLGCAGWVTETGSGDLDIADEYALSWMHWDYKLFGNKTWDSSGLFKTSGPYDKPCADRHNLTACLDVDTAKIYARTYTQAVAGHMLSFVFNKTTAQATLQFAVNTNITAPTQLFVAERWHYPQGYTVDISPPSWATWHAPKPNQVLVILNKATAVDGGTLSVTILPK